MGNFFEEFFLNSPGIYTLFGTKPLSEISLNDATYDKWLEELKPHLEGLPEKDRAKKLKKLKEYCDQNLLPSYWEKWMHWIKNHPSKNFLFLKRPTIYESLSNLSVLNVVEASWIMQEHYDLFSRELGMEFDPFSMSLEFDNPESPFWEKIFSSHLLQGILLGFGERNSYFFNLEMQDEKPLSNPSRGVGDSSCSFKLPLPAFRSYTVPPNQDPIIVKYKEEKEEIKRYLAGKDLVQEVLDRIYLKRDL
ncbi:MAG: hypothetical protein K940chlam2_00083 [Chlamydiae bacterium]|nr:hypothetical protein [Chlamydiota bacterium]